MQAELEVGRLIQLVAARPELWDRARRSREGSAAAWREVCAHLFPGFHLLDHPQQRQLGNFVSKRWRNVKDHYKKTVRLLNVQNKNGPGAKRVQKYKYHKQLSFLLRTYEPEQAERNLEHSERQRLEESVDEIKQETNTGEERYQEPSSRSNQSIIKSKLAIKRRLEENENITLLRLSDETDEERHMSFFRAILPSLVHLTEEESLQFQAGAINLLQGIKRRRSFMSQQTEQPFNSSFYASNGAYTKN